MPEMNRIRDPKEIVREKQLEEEDKAERGRLRVKAGMEDTEDEQEVVETTLGERVQTARTFLGRLAELDGADERGPLLSMIELERRLRDESDLTSGIICLICILLVHSKTCFLKRTDCMFNS